MLLCNCVPICTVVLVKSRTLVHGDVLDGVDLCGQDRPAGKLAFSAVSDVIANFGQSGETNRFVLRTFFMLDNFDHELLRLSCVAGLCGRDLSWR